MANLEDVRQAARITVDQQGKPVVQIPLDIWQEWLEQNQKPQSERIRAALQEWDAQAADLSDEWWDEFQLFLQNNRLDLSSAVSSWIQTLSSCCFPIMRYWPDTLTN